MEEVDKLNPRYRLTTVVIVRWDMLSRDLREHAYPLREDAKRDNLVSIPFDTDVAILQNDKALIEFMIAEDCQHIIDECGGDEDKAIAKFLSLDGWDELVYRIMRDFPPLMEMDFDEMLIDVK